jgi:hypothetical protein
VYYRSGNDIQHPLWTIENTRSQNNSRRVFGKTSVTYDIIENLNVTYRVGLDTYTENQEFLQNAGGVADDNIVAGLYRTINILSTIWNHDVIFGYNRDLNEDFDLSALVGANARQDEFSRDGVESQDQIVFGFVNHGNFRSQASNNSFTGGTIDFLSQNNLMGVYGDFTLGYREWLYGNFSFRNDWSSTVEPENRSKFYPGASLSFIPTTAFNYQSDYVNYVKIRFGYGTSAGFPAPYQTRNTLNTTARRFVDQAGNVVTSNGSGTYFFNNGVGATLGNPNLTPELHRELELGLESKHFNNRLSIDLTLYRRITDDLITNAPIDPATGFTTTLVNIGEIENRGIELQMTGNVLKVNDFSWDLIANFNSYTSEVNELGNDLDQVVIDGFTNLGNFAIPGEVFGAMQGTGFATDDDGNRLVDDNGNYINTDEIEIIGNPIPDFTLTGITNFSWKGLTLSAQFDWRQGGDIYSGLTRALLARGLTTDTDFDRTRTFIVPGVKSDGTPNDVQITATNLYFDNIGFSATGIDANSVYDGTTIRLRQVSLTYVLPQSILENTPFGSASISFLGDNLWFRAVNMPEGVNFDTDVLSLGVGNGQGFDFLTGPSSRRWGGTVKFTF